ncbi:hypothetical protein BCR32DRAFT_290098 [Anaeromyces robustus]|uniref:Uncharacterized protein n=1 Tax=Anaeromyces robustus TaxID=1754192 RepID=A0A1Y1XLJ7_9FUNG|nr:hypothetical protein BCR32DRAFT_290098 [Anaeromyces robustus]|eukprot:ORX86376.1 hypothetical protein BCR32DRAFT_290098 [Anaeromyces robustus]
MNSTEITTFFTYDEALQIHNKNGKKKDCKSDTDCLEGETCIIGECMFNMKCTLDKSRCVESYYNENYLTKCNTNEECLSNQCEQNVCEGDLIECIFFGKNNECGLAPKSRCTNDDDCLYNICTDDGYCEDLGIKNYFNNNFILILVMIAIMAIFVCGCCCCCFNICCRKKRSK